MPFIYRLHYSLALGNGGCWPLAWRRWWVVDCFVGFYLTLPVATKVPARQGWFARWAPAWAVRWGASRYKLNFDLHRAGGLWIWPVLLVFAISSVSFNLPQVYGPVMRALGGKDNNAIYQSALLPSPRWTRNCRLIRPSSAARRWRKAKWRMPGKVLGKARPIFGISRPPVPMSRLHLGRGYFAPWRRLFRRL
jgi:uncharacterized iron-regulated membrane protein